MLRRILGGAVFWRILKSCDVEKDLRCCHVQKDFEGLWCSNGSSRGCRIDEGFEWWWWWWWCSHWVVSDCRDPMDCSLPGSSVHGIVQARIVKWVAISFSRGSSRPKNQTWVSCIAGRFFTTDPLGKPKYNICMCACQVTSVVSDLLWPYGL